MPLPTATTSLKLAVRVTVLPALRSAVAGLATMPVSVGGVVSTVAVTADVVVVLPALSVALAVKLWLPSRSAGVV